MTALWTQVELSAALGVPSSAPLGASVTGVSIDSRTLEPGDLFFAIQGDAHDGHDHVARAFEAGAAAAVVSRERAPKLAALGPVFAVHDTLEAMTRLGVAARTRSKAKIVGVTGSVGKTTAKEMLRAMLTACGATHASAASYNNHWGVPLTLARMPANARFGVFGSGINHAGEIAPLTRMVRPHAALVTMIAPSTSNIWARSKRSPTRKPRFSRVSSRTERRSSIVTRRNSNACRRPRRRAAPRVLELWPRRRVRRPTSGAGEQRQRLAREGACSWP